MSSMGEQSYGTWEDWLLCLAIAIALSVWIPRMGKHKKKNRAVAPAIPNIPCTMPPETIQPKRIWHTVFGAQVVLPLALAVITAGGLGVLSMSPPNVKLAYGCFTVGYAFLLFRVIWWALKECTDTQPQKFLFVFIAGGVITAAWYASMFLAQSRLPITLDLTFDSFTAGVGNLPERARTSTVDGEPWDDKNYADIRLKVDNPTAKIRNLDLNLRLVGEHDDPKELPYRITAIGQTTEIKNIEFIVPQMPELAIQLRDANNETDIAPLVFHLDKGWSILPPPSIRVVVPQLLDGQYLTLIIGTVLSKPGHPENEAPPYLEVSGTGDALIAGNIREGIVKKQLVGVKHKINVPTIP